MLTSINARFLSGYPSNNVALAGVVVHQTDWMDGGWVNGDEGRAWTVDPYHSDRFAASLINKRLPHMYSTSAVGFVLNPAEVSGHILCAYPRDGGSMNKGNHGCGAGNFHGRDFLLKMMRDQATHTHYNKACLWGEPNEQDRSGCQYNELILDGQHYARRLPHVVQAFFYPIHGEVHFQEGDAAVARQLHSRFLAQYKLSAEDVPLIAFDVAKARDGKAPFVLADSERSSVDGPA